MEGLPLGHQCYYFLDYRPTGATPIFGPALKTEKPEFAPGELERLREDIKRNFRFKLLRTSRSGPNLRRVEGKISWLGSFVDFCVWLARRPLPIDARVSFIGALVDSVAYRHRSDGLFAFRFSLPMAADFRGHRISINREDLKFLVPVLSWAVMAKRSIESPFFIRPFRRADGNTRLKPSSSIFVLPVRIPDTVGEKLFGPEGRLDDETVAGIMSMPEPAGNQAVAGVPGLPSDSQENEEARWCLVELRYRYIKTMRAIRLRLDSFRETHITLYTWVTIFLINAAVAIWLLFVDGVLLVRMSWRQMLSSIAHVFYPELLVQIDMKRLAVHLAFTFAAIGFWQVGATWHVYQRVKFLRLAHGYFAAADTFNRVVEGAMARRPPDMLGAQLPPTMHIPYAATAGSGVIKVDSFIDIISALKVWIDGESQRCRRVSFSSPRLSRWPVL